MPTMTEPAPTRTDREVRAPVPPDGTSGGGDDEPRGRGLPRGLAVVITAALAALLTYLGMLTQIWANIAGSQLPGA
ncbi:MAG: hypothetical protein GEV07_06705 [Streptosporangiales bacterium]|nr:hypothetical protein [Streptosporangiales bacterium]